MSYYIVYEVKNKITGKTYIGKHQTDNIYDDYLGSGKYLKRAIKKYGKDCFEKIILYSFDNKEDMDNKEAELVNEEYVKDKNTYNLKIGGEGGYDYINSLSKMKDVRIKNIKKAHDMLKEKMKNPEYASIWSERSSKKMKKLHNECKIKYDTFTGKHHTDETKKKISEAQKNINRNGINNPCFGTCWIYNTVENKRIQKDDLPLYLEQGWVKGRKMELDKLK